MSYLNRTSVGLPVATITPSACSNKTSNASVEDSEPWFEECRTQGERELFYTLGAESYQHGTKPKHYIKDEKKRTQFMKLYFRYHFEAKLVSGDPFLACIKKWVIVNEEKQEKPIHYSIYKYDSRDPESEPKELLALDRDSTEAFHSDHEWLQRNIHTPMRKMAEDIGTEAWYCAHQITVQEFKGHRYGQKYLPQVAIKVQERGEKTRKQGNGKPFKIPPFVYVLTADVYPGAIKSLARLNTEMIWHYHYHYEPGLKCYLDPSTTKTTRTSCRLVYVRKDIAPLLQEKKKLYETEGRCSL